MALTSIFASASNSATTGTAVSVSTPAGVAPGDLAIIAVHVNTQTTIADNNGATPFNADISNYKPNPTGGHTTAIYSRRIVSGDPSSYAFTSGASGRWAIAVIILRLPNPVIIYDVAPSTSNATARDDSTTNTAVAPSITSIRPNAIHISIGFMDDGTAAFTSGPSGYTVAQSPVNQPIIMAYKVITTPGATGTTTHTWSANAPTIGLSFLVLDGSHDAPTGNIKNIIVGNGMSRNEVSS